MSTAVAHDQWPQLVQVDDQTVELSGRTDPINVYAFYSPRYKWVGLLRHPSEVVDAIADPAFAGAVWDWFRAPRSTVQVNGYDVTDLACQMRDLLTESYGIPNPTIHIRIWSDA